MQLNCVKGAKNFSLASLVSSLLKSAYKKFFRLRRSIFASFRRPVKNQSSLLSSDLC